MKELLLISALLLVCDQFTFVINNTKDSKERLASLISEIVGILENEKVLQEVKECCNSHSNEVILVENVLKVCFLLLCFLIFNLTI